MTSEDWRGRVLSLADLLAEQAGIETRRYGGVGSFQSLSIRGASGARVQVYLDDMPLNSAGGGAVDLGKIDLGLLERVEVRKGLAPAEDGGNSMGGVVRLYTRGSGDARGEGLLSLGMGSHGTQKHGLSGGSKAATGAAVFGNLAFTRSDNDFRYLDRNQTPYNPGDDGWTRRQNGAYRDLQAHAHARWPLGGGGLRFKLAHARNGGGLPGREGEVNPTAGFSNQGTQYLAGYDRGGGENAWRLGVDLSAEEENPGMHWTKDDNLGWAIAGDTVRLYSHSRKNRLQARVASPEWARLGLPMRMDALFSAGQESLEPWDEKGKPGDQASTEASGWRNSRRGVSLAADWSMTPWRSGEKSLAFTLGSQGEWNLDRTEGGQLPYGGVLDKGEAWNHHGSWRLGSLWRPRERISAYANLGRFYRLPSLIDRFGGRLGLLANPELKPETGWNAEAGLRLQWPMGFAEAGLFRNAAADAILYRQSAGLIKPYNLDATLAQGLELSLEQALPWGMRLAATATAQATSNISDTYNEGKRLPDQPAWSHHIRTSSPSWRGFRLEHRWEMRGGIFRDPGNLQRLPAQNLHHLLLGFARDAHGRRFGASVSLQNLTDEFYEDAYASYPYPGRQVHAALTFSTTPKGQP